MDQKMEGLLTAALLRGDRDAVLSLTAVAERDQLRLCKNSVLHGLTERRAFLELNGGELEICWDEGTGHVLMTGPATRVFRGEL